jgi:ketosteroid isomerase-like protein
MKARTPYRAAFAALTLALLVACSAGNGPKIEVGTKSAGATLEAAMQADRDFAAMTRKEGPRASFLKYMHTTDSQFLQPGAVVRGAEAIAGGFGPPGTPPTAFMIDWTPDGGHGSASGDLAVTTGLYTISSGGHDIEKGRYVTVWSKDAAGELKAAMDMSVPDPSAPVAPTAPTPDKPDFEGRPG